MQGRPFCLLPAFFGSESALERLAAPQRRLIEPPRAVGPLRRIARDGAPRLLFIAAALAAAHVAWY
mgnify:FL=1